jgi:hypothetical protein
VDRAEAEHSAAPGTLSSRCGRSASAAWGTVTSRGRVERPVPASSSS